FAILFILCGPGIPLTSAAKHFASSDFKTVTGTVKDAQGEPVAGASVTIKNTSAGTQTNAEGKFSIEAGEGDVLVITAIGFATRETTITGSLHYDIFLQRDVSELDQVVVVGYGTQKKGNLTGAVSYIGG